MSLTNERKKSLRTLGHQLNPIVRIASNGLTDNIITETERALSDHELIKIKINVGDRDLKQAIIASLASTLHAEVVQIIGHTALLFRKAEKPNPKLSNLIRQI